MPEAAKAGAVRADDGQRRQGLRRPSQATAKRAPQQGCRPFDHDSQLLPRQDDDDTPLTSNSPILRDLAACVLPSPCLHRNALPRCRASCTTTATTTTTIIIIASTSTSTSTSTTLLLLLRSLPRGTTVHDTTRHDTTCFLCI
ncbi:hypothetical protein PMIN06_011752 [Paraphaeosphaeria minitans]|uniref:Uncharacterized protein n=1 Tax=Paraphaeosphaeria minitans TaxID=565426 RepID=A0A9P6KLL9_9PLEO|nr:hypothetical protein PMIN01_11650 [Paraphaeosphaeria minitans]